MPRARSIKPSFFTDDELAETSVTARLLFIGLWTVADREGRLKHRPKRLKAMLLPYDDVDIEAEIDSLIASGFLKSYTIDGSAYLEVCNWHKHQRPHHKEVDSVLPAPQDADSQQEIHARAKHESSMDQARVKQIASCPTDNGYRITDNGCLSTDQTHLPDWLNVDAWNEFVVHRKTIKKPLTAQAEKINITKLTGLSPAQQLETINATIERGWTGLFPQKAEISRDKPLT